MTEARMRVWPAIVVAETEHDCVVPALNHEQVKFEMCWFTVHVTPVTPLPVRATACVEPMMPPELSVTVKVSDFAPVDVGENVSAIVQEPPAGSEFE